MAISDDLSNLDTALQGLVVPAGKPAVVRIYQHPSESTVSTAEMPALLIFWRRDPRTDFATFANVRETREYIIQFLFKPTGQGTLNDNIDDILAYREPLLNALYGAMRLDSNVNWQVPIQCSYPKTLLEKWGGQSWFGMECAVSVVDTRAPALAD